MPVVIATDRLTLRTWSPEDRPALFRLLGEPEVVRWLNLGKPFADDEIDAFLARQADAAETRGWCRFALELREPAPNDPAGVVGFCGFGCGFAPDIELGWTILPALWGRGLATEAARAAIEFAFATCGFPEVVSAILPENVRSRRVAEKIGETLDGKLVHAGLTHLRYAIVNPAPNAPSDPRYANSCE